MANSTNVPTKLKRFSLFGPGIHGPKNWSADRTRTKEKILIADLWFGLDFQSRKIILTSLKNLEACQGSTDHIRAQRTEQSESVQDSQILLILVRRSSRFLIFPVSVRGFLVRETLNKTRIRVSPAPYSRFSLSDCSELNLII